MVANCIRFQQIFDVFCHNIELQVYCGTRLGRPQVRILERMRDYCDGKKGRGGTGRRPSQNCWRSQRTDGRPAGGPDAKDDPLSEATVRLIPSTAMEPFS